MFHLAFAKTQFLLSILYCTVPLFNLYMIISSFDCHIEYGYLYIVRWVHTSNHLFDYVCTLLKRPIYESET